MATNAASTPATSGGEMVTGLSPMLLAGIAFVALVVLAIGVSMQD